MYKWDTHTHTDFWRVVMVDGRIIMEKVKWFNIQLVDECVFLNQQTSSPDEWVGYKNRKSNWENVKKKNKPRKIKIYQIYNHLDTLELAWKYNKKFPSLFFFHPPSFCGGTFWLVFFSSFSVSFSLFPFFLLSFEMEFYIFCSNWI